MDDISSSVDELIVSGILQSSSSRRFLYSFQSVLLQNLFDFGQGRSVNIEEDVVVIGFISVNDSPIGDCVVTLMSERDVDKGLVTLRILKSRSFRHFVVRVYIVVEEYLFQVVPPSVIYDSGSPERRMSIRVNSKDDFNVVMLSVIEDLVERVKVESNVTVDGREK